MFDCCLVSSLSPMVFYNTLLPMFSAGPSPGFASSGMCSPKTDSCLVASSVGGSLSFLVPSSSAPTWPPGPATLSLYKFALSWLPISRSAQNLFLTGYLSPGIRFPVPFSPGLWSRSRESESGSRMFLAGVGVGSRSRFSKLLESESGVGVGFLKLLESESGVGVGFSKLLESESGVGVGTLLQLPTPMFIK